MLEDINWISVGFAVLGAVITALIAAAGGLIAWGRTQRAVQDHDKRLDCNNGKLDKQEAQDSDLDAELRALKSRVDSRDSLWRRNNDDHVEMFSRINALEKGYAALPGQMAEMMDQRFERWRKTLQGDIKATIYQVDKEKGQKG